MQKNEAFGWQFGFENDYTESEIGGDQHQLPTQTKLFYVKLLGFLAFLDYF